MKLYLAGSYYEQVNTISKLFPANFLYNYVDMKSNIPKAVNIIIENGNSIIIDSGAYIAMTRNIEIQLDNYIEWLNVNDKLFDYCVQLDQIPKTSDFEDCARSTYTNYLYMQKRIINSDKLIYVYHIGESIKWLERALNNSDIKYIGFGGCVGKSTDERRRFLDRSFDTIYKYRKDIKTHGFGITSLSIIKEFPFTSIDSTRWLTTSINNGIITQFGDITFNTKRSKQISVDFADKLNKEIGEYGFTLDDLINSRENRLVYNAKWFYSFVNNLGDIEFKKRSTLF